MINSLISAVLIFLAVFYSTQLIRRKVRHFCGADMIRSVFFFLPYLIPPLLMESCPPNETTGGGWGIAFVLAVGASLFALIWQWPEYKALLNKDIYSLMQAISFRTFVILELSLIGSAVCEEWFYRLFLVELLKDWGIVGAVVLTSAMFSFSHYMQRDTREEFSWKSYITLFMLGLAWSYSIVISQSLLPAVIGHFLYNFPSMLSTFWNFSMPRKLQKQENHKG